MVCVPARRHVLTHTHGHTLLPESFWGINIKSGNQPIFFFFEPYIELYLLLLSETNDRRPFLTVNVFFADRCGLAVEGQLQLQ